MNKEKEQKIISRFENSVNALKEQGYGGIDCTIPLGKGMFYMLLTALPFAAVIAILYFIFADVSFKLWEAGVLLGALVLSIPVHECIHAVFWAAACGGFKGIRLGFDKKTFTPYCAAEKPMERGKYLFGCLAPFFILGILSGIFAIIFSKLWLLILSVFNVLSAGGDTAIALKAIGLKRGALLLDHQQKAGFLAFYKR